MILIVSSVINFSLSNPVTGMDHEEFYKLLATYKFTIAMENGVCSDYITEKFWRPFMVGSVPIIFGSPTSKVLLDNQSCKHNISCITRVKFLCFTALRVKI